MLFIGPAGGRVVWGRLLPLAGAGALLGHFIAYGVAPAAHVHASGSVHVHGYLASAAPVVVAAAVLTVGVALIEPGHRAAGRLPLRLLFGMQVGLFVAQEAAERLVVGSPLGSLLSEPVLWVGIGAQALVAGALLRVLRGIRRAVHSIRLGEEVKPAFRPVGGLQPVAVGNRLVSLRYQLTRRGPPAVS